MSQQAEQMALIFGLSHIALAVMLFYAMELKVI